MMLILESLEKAIAKLERYQQHANQYEKANNIELFDLSKTALIQVFKDTYELSIKLIKRQLIEMESSARIETLVFKDLIRTAARLQILQSPEAWFRFRELRNITAHTYDEDKAAIIYNQIPSFFQESSFLLKQLQKIN